MPGINDHITKLNRSRRKALSIFLTAGYPGSSGFTDLAKSILDSGADMLEIGIPFSDPLADGPVIQQSSQNALKNGINLKTVFEHSYTIAAYTKKPLILMGYANSLLKYGLNNFYNDALNSGVKGIIIPDVPVDEYDDFFSTKPEELDTILLAAPTSGRDRIREIDDKSSGFVYCVSMNGTTGRVNSFNSGIESSLKEIRSNVKKNKMLTGFGISTPEDIRRITHYCDGVIVGSAIISSLSSRGEKKTLRFVEELSKACG